MPVSTNNDERVGIMRKLDVLCEWPGPILHSRECGQQGGFVGGGDDDRRGGKYERLAYPAAATEGFRIACGVV
jgi:hypothetical protein